MRGIVPKAMKVFLVLAFALPLFALWLDSLGKTERITAPGKTTIRSVEPGTYDIYGESSFLGTEMLESRTKTLPQGVDVVARRARTTQTLPLELRVYIGRPSHFDSKTRNGSVSARFEIPEPGDYEIDVKGTFPWQGFDLKRRGFPDEVALWAIAAACTVVWPVLLLYGIALVIQWFVEKLKRALTPRSKPLQ